MRSWPLERVLFALAGTASLVLRRGCRPQSVIYDDSDRARARVKEVTI